MSLQAPRAPEKHRDCSERSDERSLRNTVEAQKQLIHNLQAQVP